MTIDAATSPTIYTPTTEDITFALTKTKEQPLLRIYTASNGAS